MHERLLLRLSLSLLGSLPLALSTEAQDEDQEAPVPVAPVPLVEGGGEELETTFRREFREERWLRRLADPDLEAREASFADLLQRARLDLSARLFLERLAHDTNQPDLAWTARLALRTLGPDLPRAGVGTGSESYESHFAELFDAMITRRPELQFGLPPTTRSPGSGVGQLMDVRLQKGPDGARVEITERNGGEVATRRHAGEDLDSLLLSIPELRDVVRLVFVDVPETLDLRLSIPKGTGVRSMLDPFEQGGLRGVLGFPGPGAEGSPEGSLEDHFVPTGPVAVRTDVLGVYVERLPQSSLERISATGGLRVLRLVSGTIADVMGVRADDVLLFLNGTPLTRPQDITDVLDARDSNDPITLVWIDDIGERIQVTWTPDSPQR